MSEALKKYYSNLDRDELIDELRLKESIFKDFKLQKSSIEMLINEIISINLSLNKKYNNDYK